MAENVSKWYAVHTISGKESKVRDYILADIAKTNSALASYITQVLSPTEKKVKVTPDGKKKDKEVLLFPGYVFIEAIYAKELPSLLRDNIPYVMGFVGNDLTKEPNCLSAAEVRRLQGYQTDFEQFEDAGLCFHEGEVVKIIADSFNGFSGTIDEVNNEKKKLKVLVSIFGRNTTVELSFTQVEKE